MRLFDYIRIGLKNIWRRKLRSSLTIVAVVVGAIAVLSLVTLVLSASTVLVSQFEALGALTQVTVTSDVEASGKDDPFAGQRESDQEGKKIDDAAIEEFKKIDHVIDVSASINVWGFEWARYKDQDRFRVNMTAYEPNAASDKTLVAGRNLRAGDKKLILIDEAMAAELGFEDDRVGDVVGEKLIFTTYEGFTGDDVELPEPPTGPDGDNEKFWEEFGKKTFDIEAEIVGVVMTAFGPGGGGGATIYIPMDWGKEIMTRREWKEDKEARKELEQQAIYDQFPQKLIKNYEFEDIGYSFASIKVDNAEHVEEVSEKVKALDFGAIIFKDFLDNLLKLFSIIGTILGTIGGVSLGVASLGIINTMVMSTYERTREIGVMRACGATRGTIRRLFTFEATLLGFLGGVVGVGCMFILAKVGNIFGNKLLAEEGIPLENIISPPLWLTLGVVGFTAVIGLIAGLYPAFRAARLDPVEALRRE